MYHHFNVHTGAFLTSIPDEKNAEAQRSKLEKDLPLMRHTDIVTGLLHMTEGKVPKCDWTSNEIIGPRGGSALFKLEQVKAEGTLGQRLQKAQNDFKSKLAELHRSIAAQAAALTHEYERAVAGLLKEASGKGHKASMKTVVVKAGYDDKGEWHDVG